MAFVPLQLLALMFAGWVNRRQLDVIGYLQEENRVLKERLGGGASDSENAQLLSLSSRLTDLRLAFLDITRSTATRRVI